MCNNFAYVIMLCAAKDILASEQGLLPRNSSAEDKCQKRMVHRECTLISTGSVLLADILPALIVKIFAPFVTQRIPFGIRHLLVVLLQATSFIVVATSSSVASGLAGVVVASIGSGLGEVTYLSLSSYFPSNAVAAWSSGTGGAGVFGAFAYAALTDAHMLSLSPRKALLSMLLIPVVFTFTYWYVLAIPARVHRVVLLNPSTYLVPNTPSPQHTPRVESEDEGAQLIESESEDDEPRARHQTFTEKASIVKPLLRFMIPLALVYFAEYFINQGLVELLVFDCKHGFDLSKSSQYRWYQVLYQVGVFISRSSAECITLPPSVLPLLSLFQLMNAAFFFFDAVYQFLPHIAFVFGFVFCEGLLGGAAYVNTFSAIHKTVAAKHREFSIGFASMSDSFGITCAGLLAIPAHNYICRTL